MLLVIVGRLTMDGSSSLLQLVGVKARHPGLALAGVVRGMSTHPLLLRLRLLVHLREAGVLAATLRTWATLQAVAQEGQ